VQLPRNLVSRYAREADVEQHDGGSQSLGGLEGTLAVMRESRIGHSNGSRVQVQRS
jgi:hypothetical protein